MTNREFSKALGAGPSPPRVDPDAEVRGRRARGGELADIVMGGARVLPRRATDLGFEFRYTEIDPAMEAALR